MPQLFYSEADVGLSVLGLRDIDGKDITGQVIPKEVDNYIKCEKYEGISSYKFKGSLSEREGHPACAYHIYLFSYKRLSMIKN
mgnify:CR=1 FL=1